MQTLIGPEPTVADLSQTQEPDQDQEFEIVLGRRQVASLLFLATVVVVLFSAVAYIAGRGNPTPARVTVQPRAPAVIQAAPPPIQPAAEIAPPKPAPQPVAVARPASAPTNEPPVFADPSPGQLYIQMGAVERGIGVIFAEGLRKEGLSAFVAPGPSERICRVLIGPLPNAEATKAAKARINDLGLTTFMRRYQADASPSH